MAITQRRLALQEKKNDEEKVTKYLLVVEENCLKCFKKLCKQLGVI